MSTGKRLAKRSILGTRVVVPGEDGMFYPGLIQVVPLETNADNENQVLETKCKCHGIGKKLESSFS
jgi:hypothetical protein